MFFERCFSCNGGLFSVPRIFFDEAILWSTCQEKCWPTPDSMFCDQKSIFVKTYFVQSAAPSPCRWCSSWSRRAGRWSTRWSEPDPLCCPSGRPDRSPGEYRVLKNKGSCVSKLLLVMASVDPRGRHQTCAPSRCQACPSSARGTGCHPPRCTACWGGQSTDRLTISHLGNQAATYSTLKASAIYNPHLLSKSPGLTSGELARENTF